MRLWLWSLGGCLLILSGIAVGLVGWFLLLFEDEGSRLFPFWLGASVLIGALAVMLLGLWFVLRRGFGRRQRTHP